MTRDQARVSRLAAICEEWGGGLSVVPRRFWRDDLASIDFVYPVAHDWASCHVFIDRPEAWPYAIHEMSHCFAMKFPVEIAGPTEPPAWNFLMACQLDADAGRDWISFFRTYGLNLGHDLRVMTDSEISRILAFHVHRERGLGLIDGLSPVPIRRGPFAQPPPPCLPGPPYVRVEETMVYSSP